MSWKNLAWQIPTLLLPQAAVGSPMYAMTETQPDTAHAVSEVKSICRQPGGIPSRGPETHFFDISTVHKFLVWYFMVIKLSNWSDMRTMTGEEI